MELYDESIDNQKKNKKLYIALIIGIVVLIVLIIAIFGMIIYLKKTIWKYEFNGKENNMLKEIIIFDDESKLYIPIREIADYVGYNSFRGDYINTSEEENKCYVKTLNEIIMFEEGSNIVKKKSEKEKNEIIEYVEIDEPVIRKNGKLCVTTDGIFNSLNMIITCRYSEKTVKVFTLEYLYEEYNLKAANYGFESISDNFQNQLALLQNLVVGKANNLYGVYDLENESIVLENKYKEITYISKTDELLVVDENGKKGVITREKKNKINVNYDDLEVVSENNKIYYVVKKDGKIGLIDSNGNIIFDPIIATNSYVKIGVDVDEFKANNIENPYVFFNKLIPVKNNKGLWGFVDKTTGKEVIECQYKNLGCINKDEAKENVLIISSQKVIVVSNGTKYDLITDSGKSLYEMGLDSVYMTVDGNDVKYFLTGENKIVDAEKNIIDKYKKLR